MSEWFRRSAEKIITYDKREIVEGTWLKCPKCRIVLYHKQLEICINTYQTHTNIKIHQAQMHLLFFLHLQPPSRVIKMSGGITTSLAITANCQFSI